MRKFGAPVQQDETESDRVYRLVKREIITGVREPGSQLSQESIATSANSSRTPAREAILRLAGDGLVRMTPRHGAKVHEITIRDFIEINQLRLILEGHAAHLAATRIPDLLLTEFQQEISRFRATPSVNSKELAELDQSIHRAIGKHSGNRRLAEWIEQLNDLTTLARNRDVELRKDTTIRSLSEIVAALQSRDSDISRRLLEAHIGEFATSLQSLGYWSPDES